MKKEELQVGQVVDIKYRTFYFGDKLRWLNNLTLLEIGEEYEVKARNGSYKDRTLVFLQQRKKPVKFYIHQSEIYYIRKH